MAKIRPNDMLTDSWTTQVLTPLALAGMVISATLGCGGMDQDDMRRYALQRPSDEEDEPSTTPPAPQQKTPTSTQQVKNAPKPVAVQPTAPSATQIPDTGQGGDNHQAAPPTTNHSAQLSDTRQPNADMTATERRQMSIDNLKRIAEAFEKHLAATGNYPPQTVHSTAGQPLLSWRVALLPFLGYEPLYQAFRHNEPWNSPHNRSLIAQIPSVYQSPERFDTRTNYLLPVGSSTAFAGRTTIPPRRWEDGVENTAILLEVDDDRAVEWTQPLDYKVDARQPTAGLGRLRGDGFFTMWGGGMLSMVPASVNAKDARAMFSVDGGEAFSSYSISKPTTAAVAVRSAPQGPAATVSNQTADTVTLATTRVPVFEGSAVPLPAASASNDELTKRAVNAFRAGYESESLDFLMLAYLMDEPATGIEYRWIPALRRPAFAVRYGVGIQYSGPNRNKLEKLKINKGPNEWGRHSQGIRNVTGDLAGQLLDSLESSPRFLPASLKPDTSKVRRGQPAVRGIEFLGVASRNTLQVVAKRQNVDVLIIFGIEERVSRGGREIREARLRLLDPMTRRELMVSPVINSVKRKEGLGTPLYKDPVDLAQRKFESLISHQLQPQVIPAALRPKHAAKRVSSFRLASDDSPLKALSEIRFYHRRDLLKVDQALAAYQALLGDETGLHLLAGKPQQRADDLQRWMPSVRIAEQPPRRASRDDDDD